MTDRLDNYGLVLEVGTMALIAVLLGSYLLVASPGILARRWLRRPR